MTPDWLIMSISPSTRSRYFVEGENTSSREIDRRFSWHVDSIANPRYAAHPDASDEVKTRIAEIKGGEVYYWQSAPPLKCGACARIGTNDTRPMAHAPGCPNDKGGKP
jgi:hypothetical protein